MLRWFLAAVLCAALTVPTIAGTVLTAGPVQLGIRNDGALIEWDGILLDYIGLKLAGQGDAVTPGYPYEAWGVAASGIAGGASYAGPVGNLTLVSFTTVGSTATSVVKLHTLPDLQVTHLFEPAVWDGNGALFKVTVSMANLGSSTLTDLRYVRVVDFDVPPTIFSETITVGGLPATNLLLVHNDGFETANPLAVTDPIGSFPPNTNVSDWGPEDQGTYVLLGFGDLEANAVKQFTMFYGAAYNESAAMNMLTAVGAEVYSLAQPNTGAGNTFILAFKGIGGTPLGGPVIPEPGTWALMLSGLAPVALRLRKKA
jgi:hypothetical protein